MLKPGDKLLNYEIIRPLGKGGTSTVYLARDANLDMEVAVKLLREDDLRVSAMVQRLRTGAKAAARLRHPHVQQVFFQGIEPTSDVPFVVMEYLPGGDLRARVGKLSMEQALSIFADICEAVAYAHDHGVIHRDLKPDNVLFNQRGDVVVTDFDLARVEGEARFTQMGQTLGTLYYLSPEQARGDPIDRTTDIYALGVILFELMTGTWPFTGQTATDILRGHLQSPPPRASSLNPEVPPHLDEAILRAMAKDPKQRFQNALDFAAAVFKQPGQPRAPSAAPADDEMISTLVERPKTPAPAVKPAAGAGAPILEVLDGPLAGKKFALGPAASLGYNPENNIVLPDKYLSGVHARIDREGDAYLLRDLKSTNGTSVNGAPLAAYVPHALKSGDVIEVGDTHLRFAL